MNKYLNKIMIIDGSYMLHRALHTPALSDLQTSTGMKSGGVFGFLRMLQSEIRKFSGYFPIVCWDKGLSKRRTDIYPDYKANRARLAADALIAGGVDTSEEDDYLAEYHRQRSDLIRILRSFGIPSLLLPGWEGDDLQYLLSLSCEEGIIVSDDRDMIQLISPTITIRRAMRDETITWDNCDPCYLNPRYTIMKSIVGDGSDNIPQVAKGLGDKGADDIAKLCGQDDSLDQFKDKVIESKDDESLPKRMRTNCQKLLDNWDQFIINYNLINLRLVETPIGFEEMIKDLITGVIGKPNLFESYRLIGAYEITTIFPDQIIFSITPASVTVLK